MSIKQISRLMIEEYALDIIRSEGMQSQKRYRHHGDISVFEHSMGVVYLSIYLVKKFRIPVNEKALVRGALLHDYYLYDWHIPDASHRLHGFHHAKTALRNASRDFQLNEIERDIIRKHMFPLNLALPRYRESVIVCIADKISATLDYCSVPYGFHKFHIKKNLTGKK